MNNLRTAAGHGSARVHPLGLLVSAALLFTGSTLPVVAGGRAVDETARRPAVEKSKTAAKSTASKPAAGPRTFQQAGSLSAGAGGGVVNTAALPVPPVRGANSEHVVKIIRGDTATTQTFQGN